jgi:uncharacterized surface protein with fasciclin (FAS1) repeats
MKPRLIASVAEQAGFHMFASALRSTDHIRSLEGAGPFTVFAPTDAAFGKFSTAALDRLLDGDEKLRELVIGYHIAKGKVVASQFRGKRIRAAMSSGGDVIIDGRAGLCVNGAIVVQSDIASDNGVIHGLDTVLWPSTA